MTYILYPVLFNAVQTQKERIKFYTRTLKHYQRGSSQFSPFKNKFSTGYHQCSFKKKHFILFVNTDVRNLSRRILFTIKEKVKDLTFLKLYLLYHFIWLRFRISQAIIKCVFIAISGMYTYCEYFFQKLWKSWTTPELNCCTSKENWAVYNDFNRERSQGSVIIGLVW